MLRIAEAIGGLDASVLRCLDFRRGAGYDRSCELVI